jgi:hypothetical protein
MGVRTNRVAWFFCIGVTLSHIVTLPVVVTFDSEWYVRLSDVLGTPLYPAQWDFLRTPIFPALLKFAFWLWGRQAVAVFALQSCLALSGIWFIARTLQKLGLPIQSALAVALLGCFPTLIAYQHLLLTEVGSFFFLALLISMLAWPRSPSLGWAAALGAAVGLGFYYRSSLIYLGPVLGAVYVLNGLREEWKRPGRALFSHFVRISLPQFLAIAALPFILAYPWQRNPKVAERNGYSVLLFGLLTQAVIPVDDPILGPVAPVYAHAIQDSQANGALPNQGLTNGRQYAVLAPLARYASSAGSIFLRTVAEHPDRYLGAVERNLILFSGFDGSHYDNAMYRQIVLSANASQIDPGPPSLPALGDSFKRTTAPSFTAAALEAIAPVYDRLVELGLLATVAGFLLGLWRWDSTILAFTAPTLAFIAMHALLLMSQDRMILPAQPFLLISLILLPAWLRIPVPRLQGIGFGRWQWKKAAGVALAVSILAAAGFAAFSLLSPSHRTLPAGIPSAASIAPDLGGSIDLVNAAPVSPAQLGDPSHPLTVNSGGPVVIEGWLSLGDPVSTAPPDEVDALLNGVEVKADVVQRPDVSGAFHNPRMDRSGFRLTLPPGDLPPGVTRVEILGLTRTDGRFHRYRQSIYLLAR